MAPLLEGRGGVDTLYKGIYKEALPKRVTFSLLQEYKSSEILQVEVYERVGKSVI